MGGGPTYVERATEDSPGEIRACYRLYAAHHRSRRPAVVGHFSHLRKDACIVRRSVVRPRCSGGALKQWLGCGAEIRKLRSRKVERTCHGRVWRGEREPPSKTAERAQQLEQADRVVVEAFADLHEARRLRSNPAISPGAVQRLERKAWNGLIDYLMKLPPLPSDD